MVKHLKNIQFSTFLYSFFCHKYECFCITIQYKSFSNIKMNSYFAFSFTSISSDCKILNLFFFLLIISYLSRASIKSHSILSSAFVISILITIILRFLMLRSAHISIVSIVFKVRSLSNGITIISLRIISISKSTRIELMNSPSLRRFRGLLFKSFF